MRAVLLLLLASIVLCNANHWFVWTQTTDSNGEWGFLNFYPKQLTVNPGDTVTFIQNHDAGIIAIFNATAPPPIQFYVGANPPACSLNGSCIALTTYSVPHIGGINGSIAAATTHIDSLTTFDYSAGFMAAADEGLGAFGVPSVWNFYFDPALLPSGGQVAVTVYEVLHVMKMTIIVDSVAVTAVTPAQANVSAQTQIAADQATVPTIFASTVQPVNGANYDNNICAWTVHLGAQVSGSNIPANGYGIGSFDRFLPFDTVNRESVIDINEGDRINFLQLTPHAHSVSIYNITTPFAPEAISFDPVAGTLTQPSTHYIPNIPPVAGITHWDGIGHCVLGPMLFPGNNATVEFSAAGTYKYLCHFHEAVNMVGTIVVHPASSKVAYPSGTPSKCKDLSTSSAASLFPLALLVALLAALML